MADWTIRLIDETGYVGIFLLMFLETVFPPIPSEVIMPIAGARAANGPLALWAVIGSGTAGAMLGNLFWYALARVIGIRRFRPFIERYGRWQSLRKKMLVFWCWACRSTWMARRAPGRRRREPLRAILQSSRRWRLYFGTNVFRRQRLNAC